MSAGMCIPSANVKRAVAKKARKSMKRALMRLDATPASKCLAVAFQLPAMPVPLSSCFNNFGKRRIESERYKAWKEKTDTHVVDECQEVCGLASPTVTGPVRVRYYVKRPDNRVRDLDNLLKALNDTLTRLRIIEDDSKIVDLGIAWARAEIPNDCAVHVEVEAA